MEKKTISVILFRDVPHSISRIQLAQHCSTFVDDPILRSTPHAVQSSVSPEAFTYFVEILGCPTLHFSPETFDEMIIVGREFGYNSLITSLAPKRDVRGLDANIHDLLHELDRKHSITIIETNFQSNRDSFAVMQCRISAIADGFDGKLERIPSELGKMIELVKRPSRKH
jgi:hypothetical protein